MVVLTRSVRMCINPGEESASQRGSASSRNTFSAFPSMQGLGRYYELVVSCVGEVDPRTGYFLNIKEIDDAVRSLALPVIQRACHHESSSDPSCVLERIMVAMRDSLGGSIVSVRWMLTPYYSLEMLMPSAAESRGPARVLIRQQFEFAAAHRLHSPLLSDEDNRRIFGKCNHPAGHGHNYRVEPCVETPVTSAGGECTLADIESLTSSVVIDRYDHKHLNIDTPEFDPTRGGVTPSVENIARIIFERLSPELAAKRPGSRLVHVTVWETEKTSSRYPVSEGLR